MADAILEEKIEADIAEARIALKARDRKGVITALSRAMAKAGDL